MMSYLSARRLGLNSFHTGGGEGAERNRYKYFEKLIQRYTEQLKKLDFVVSILNYKLYFYEIIHCKTCALLLLLYDSTPVKTISIVYRKIVTKEFFCRRKMAPRNYDVLLHSRKKSKKVTQMNRTITPKHMQNNNKRYQQKYFISSKDLRQQKRNKIEQQSTPLTSSVKNRLTLNTNNVLLRRNNASSSQNNTIVKNVQKTEQGKEIKLFTKHFDARSKLSSKKLTSPGKKKMKNMGKSSEEIVSLSKGLAKVILLLLILLCK